MPHTPFTMPNAQCPMPNAQCPIPQTVFWATNCTPNVILVLQRLNLYLSVKQALWVLQTYRSQR
ncbi:MAG: hypothetical protein V7K68_18500 [Nostoc sp.]|uniref:hypothetical protein n=1 Tax=Nostoc sp. TaxID=1180 RepID=UPI002FF5B440